jgi:Mn2+/Fe2+ NRAMP family transporter
MFSTTLTVTDAFPRVMSKLVQSEKQTQKKFNAYHVFIVIIPMVALVILYFLNSTFTVLVDFAAGLSFLASPVLAWFNLKLIIQNKNKNLIKISPNYILFSRICLFFLVCFGLGYLVFKFLS